MALIILTKSPRLDLFSKETYKNFFRQITGKTRGPQAVTASILRGLKRAPQEYKFNPSTKEIKNDDILWINESISALKWAIDFKKSNKDSKLVVGPNLVVTPDDHGGIIYNENINIILQPSEWTRNFYLKYKPELATKIKIWPAGVKDPYKGELPLKEDYFILYQKNAPEELFMAVAKEMDDRGLDYRLIRYGYFTQKKYFSLLDNARAMVYLSTSESQGLALQEAWIRNVPTLVWDRGYFEKDGLKFESEKVSCPHLTPESGMTFKNKADFIEKLEKFIAHLGQFTARDYAVQNLSDKITTQKFLDIIRSI